MSKTRKTYTSEFKGQIVQLYQSGKRKTDTMKEHDTCSSMLGKRIIEQQVGKEKAEHGAGLIKKISKQMTKDVEKSFTSTNLKYMRQICEAKGGITFEYTNIWKAKMF